jgi:eukaryotic-like serine/threonine-protein kinase
MRDAAESRPETMDRHIAQPRKLKKCAAVTCALLAIAVFMLWNSPQQEAQSPAGVAANCPNGMAFVPGGTFPMGTTQQSADYLLKFCRNTLGNCDPMWFVPETPRRTVGVNRFCIDKYEYPNAKKGLPQAGLTWSEAQRACVASGKRLCTQEEWEHACSNNDGRAWAFGNRYKSGVCAISDKAIYPGGAYSKCRSVYDVYDMNGNLAEWTSSPAAGEKNPGPDAPRIVRGGSYRDGPVFTRCAFRDSFTPDSRYNTIGFRCCYSAH